MHAIIRLIRFIPFLAALAFVGLIIYLFCSMIYAMVAAPFSSPSTVKSEVQEVATALKDVLRTDPEADISRLADVDVDINSFSRISIEEINDEIVVVGTSANTGESYKYVVGEEGVEEISPPTRSYREEVHTSMSPAENAEATTLLQQHQAKVAKQASLDGTGTDTLAVVIGTTSYGSKVYASAAITRGWTGVQDTTVRGWVDGYENQGNMCVAGGCSEFSTNR